MNKNQVNRKEMQDSVISFLDANAQKTTSIPKVMEFKNKLCSVNQLIELSQADQQETKVTIGNSKTRLKKTIAEKADIMNDIVEAYAIVTDNAELESKMSDSATSLLRLGNEKFVVRVDQVIRETISYSDILKKEYGLTEEQVIDLQCDVDNFRQMNGQPRAYQIASSQATQDLEQLFADANQVLTQQLDKVMKIFKRRDPTFYNGYLAARVVIDK